MTTEAYRPSRSEYPRPSTPAEELHLMNADRFIDAYSRQITLTRHLLNHVGTIPFGSEDEKIKEREACWAEYLYQDPPPPGQWIWGRTILAEVVSKGMIETMMKNALEASAMFVDYVPTSIDGSSWRNTSPYQKGVDICLIQMQPLNGEAVMYPVCGIDVTVGGQVLVDKKRDRPGFQSQIAMPAIVVPLGEFKWGPEWDWSFNTYLDQCARQQILEEGTYTAFHGLDRVEKTEWERIMREQMQIGLSRCRDSMQRVYSGFASPAEYKYLDDVIAKIQQTKRLVRGKPLPLPAEATVAPS